MRSRTRHRVPSRSPYGGRIPFRCQPLSCVFCPYRVAALRLPCWPAGWLLSQQACGSAPDACTCRLSSRWPPCGSCQLKCRKEHVNQLCQSVSMQASNGDSKNAVYLWEDLGVQSPQENPSPWNCSGQNLCVTTATPTPQETHKKD